MQNYMGFLVNDEDMVDSSMGYSFDPASFFSEIGESLVTSAKDAVKTTAPKALNDFLAKELNLNKSNTTTSSDGTIVVQREVQPIYQYMTQPSKIPTWGWVTLGVVGVSVLGFIVYKLARK